MKRIELLMDDNTSLDFISLVEDPAIEVDFFYFSKQSKKDFGFKTTDEEQRIVTGPAMIPNKDILRVDEVGNFYNVFFSPLTIRKAAELFFKNSNPNETNINHEAKVMTGVTVFESWIVDALNGKGGGKNYEDATNGTWMVSYKIDNKDIWDNFIKTGKIKGFSVEGNFIMKEDVFSAMRKILEDTKTTIDEKYKLLQIITN